MPDRRTRRNITPCQVRGGLAVLDEHGLARADIAALEVRGRIALGMPKLPPVGKRLAQTEQQIVLHIRVGVFVDGDTGGRMRTVHHGKTALHTALADDFTQSGGDIVHALVIGRDGKIPWFSCSFSSVFVQIGRFQIGKVQLYGKRVLLECMRECEAAALDRLVKAAHVPAHGDGLLRAQPHEPLDQEHGFFAVTVRKLVVYCVNRHLFPLAAVVFAVAQLGLVETGLAQIVQERNDGVAFQIVGFRD